VHQASRIERTTTGLGTSCHPCCTNNYTLQLAGSHELTGTLERELCPDDDDDEGEKQKSVGRCFCLGIPVILRLYLHRETCTPEPAYETGQGGPALQLAACNAMALSNCFICRGQRVPLRSRVHWWYAVVLYVGVEFMGGASMGWICIERGANAMPDIASLFQPMSCSPFYDRRGDDQRRLEVGLFCYHTYCKSLLRAALLLPVVW